MKREDRVAVVAARAMVPLVEMLSKRALAAVAATKQATPPYLTQEQASGWESAMERIWQILEGEMK